MSIGFCFHVWNTDPNAYHAIRHELGRKIEGTRADFPYLNAPYVHPYGNYYVNFQNASGTNFQPFSFNGTSWIPIGWDGFDVSRGFGWCSQCAFTLQPRVRPCVRLCLMFNNTGGGGRQLMCLVCADSVGTSTSPMLNNPPPSTFSATLMQAPETASRRCVIVSNSQFAH